MMKKKDIFYNTKVKVILLSTAIVFIALFIFAMITKTLYTSRIFKDVDYELTKQKEFIDMDFTSEGGKANNIIKEKPGRLPPHMPPNIIAIIHRENEVYLISPNPYFDEENLPSFENKTSEGIQNIDSNGYKFRGIAMERIGFTIQLMINVDSEIQSINQLMNSIVISFSILIVVSLALAYFLSSRIIKPVKEAYDKQVFFVQDASHEMRTPLAIIKGKLEILAGHWEDTIESHFDHISKMMSEVRALEKLNSDLLLLSKEDINSTLNITRVDLKDFIKDISEFYEDLAEVQNKNFVLRDTKEPMALYWDYSKVKRIIIILLENSFKYTKEQGNILLSIEDSNKNLKIMVKDDGIGIKEEDQKRIFDRFFRSADVRAQNINGSGIGLSLLKSIANTLHVKVRVLSQYGGGTEFILTIPKSMK